MNTRGGRPKNKGGPHTTEHQGQQGPQQERAGDKPPRGWAATGGKPRGGGKEGLVAKLADREGLLLSLILAVRMKLSPVPQARVSGIWTCLSSWSRFT